MDKLTKKQIEECKDAFSIIGKDEINSNELKKVLLYMGYDISQEQWLKMKKEFDKEDTLEEGEKQSSLITYVDFLTLMTKYLQTIDAQKGTIEAFEEFDPEKTGFISQQQLKYILNTFGEQISDEEFEDFLVQTEVREDGNIEYGKFVKSLFSNI